MLLEDLLQGNLEFALRYQAILRILQLQDLVNKKTLSIPNVPVRYVTLGMLMPLENSYKIIST